MHNGPIQSIVLYEPDAQLRALYRNWLSKAGYQLKSAPDIQSTFEQGLHGCATLMLIDIDMPQASDIFFLYLAKLRNDVRRKEFTVCALIDRRSTKKITSAIEFGGDFLLTKPLSAVRLLAHIERMHRDILLRRNSKKFISLKEIDFFYDIARTLPREDAIKLLAAVFNSMILAKAGRILGDDIVEIIVARTNRAIEQNGMLRGVRAQGRRIDLSEAFCAPCDQDTRDIVNGFRTFTLAFLEFVQQLTSNILIERLPKSPSAKPGTTAL